jgi:hypothetical protein
VKQFQAQGYTQLPCPPLTDILPLRFPEMLHRTCQYLFEKGDMHMLLFATTQTPRTKDPHIGHTFLLLSTTLGDDHRLRQLSGAVRSPAEKCSIVDLLTFDSYPGISPLPDAVVFASDMESAKAVLQVIQEQNQKPDASLVVHRGRLFRQLAC